jgi:hypothetical protein
MTLRLLAVTAIQVSSGIRLFSTSPVPRLREQLLAERAAAPPEKQGDYVEAKPRPDIVQISFLTGMLSFVSVPVVFGPAAVVTGVTAVAKGHPSGLIGLILGLVGVIGWAVVFTMFWPIGPS